MLRRLIIFLAAVGSLLFFSACIGGSHLSFPGDGGSDDGLPADRDHFSEINGATNIATSENYTVIVGFFPFNVREVYEGDYFKMSNATVQLLKEDLNFFEEE